MSRRARLLLALAAAAGTTVFASGAAPAAVITIVNGNDPGVGFNDPTAATPVGGNPGTTLGQQRLNAFQHAADIWGSLIDSPVEIKIRAKFEPLDCTADNGTLGSAGPTGMVSDFPGAPLPGTWFASALANRIAGSDLRNGIEDITASFNSSVGTATCLSGSSWYYGFDNNHGDAFDLVNVLLHEFAHGLGFLTTVDDTAGTELGGQPDVFETHILDVQAGKHWDEMTDAERIASSVHTGQLVWDGINVEAQTPSTLDPLPLMTVSSPAAVAGDYGIGAADFGAEVTPAGVTGVLAGAVDPADAAGNATTDACSPITNASQVAGKIALIDRGTCPFVNKAANAQAAGAIGVVIANNQVGGPPGMSGDAPGVTIPVVSVTQADGAALRAQLDQGVTVKIWANPRRLAGAGSEGRMLLFAPNPVQEGSSISHWDTSAQPNLLMEPNLSSDLPHEVDLTLPLLRDIGWFPDSGPAPGLRNPAQRLPADSTTREVTRP